MTRREIREKFDEIVAFAEVERVHRHAGEALLVSGMYVRLAFAVAAHLEPEILIVDEVLAVGDAEFQKKCLGKMDEVAQQGRTVLFVSHNMSVIKALCPSAIWLDRGVVRRQGAAEEVVGEYLAAVSPSQDRFVKLEDVQRLHKLEDSLRLLSLEWDCDLPLRHGEPIRGRIQFRARTKLQDVVIGIGFANLEGDRVLTYETDSQVGFRPSVSQTGDYCVEFAVAALPLAPDMYALDVFLSFEREQLARLCSGSYPGRGCCRGKNTHMHH